MDGTLVTFCLYKGPLYGAAVLKGICLESSHGAVVEILICLRFPPVGSAVVKLICLVCLSIVKLIMCEIIHLVGEIERNK